MTLHQLRIFLSVSKHLNVTQASQELHITQPAVSRQLKLLEDEVAAKLYTVGPRGIQLTGEGRLLVNGAEQIMSEVERVKSSLRGEKMTPTLRIGENESLSFSTLPLICAAFQRVFSGVEIKIRTDSSQAIEKMVLESEIEVAVVTSPSFHPLLNYEYFRKEKLVVFASAKHPLTRKQKVRSPDLAGVPLVIKTNSELDEVIGNLERKGIKLHVAMTCDSEWGVREAVKAEVGVGILYQEILAPDIRRGELKIIKIMDLKMEVDSHIVFHKARPLSPAAERFREILREWQQQAKPGIRDYVAITMAQNRYARVLKRV